MKEKKSMPVGIKVLSIVDAIAGLSSAFFLMEALFAHHSDMKMIGIAGLAYTGSIGVTGIGLVLGNNAGLRIATSALYLAMILPLLIGVAAFLSPKKASHDFAYADFIGLSIISLAAITLSGIPFLQRLYLGRAAVREFFVRQEGIAQ